MLKVKMNRKKSNIKYAGDMTELYWNLATLISSLCAALNEDPKGEGDRLFRKMKWYFNQEDSTP